MKGKLLCNETKVTFGGEDDGGFDYKYRPLSVGEKERVRSHIAWKEGSVDFSKTDVTELLLLSVISIDRFDVDGFGKIDTIHKLLGAKLDLGDTEAGMLKAMWIEIWLDLFVPESLKKKLLLDSTPPEKG